MQKHVIQDYENLVNHVFGYKKIIINSHKNEFKSLPQSISYYVKIASDASLSYYIDVSLPDNQASTVISFCIGLLYNVQHK